MSTAKCRYGGGIDGWIPPPHQYLLVLDWPSLVTSSNFRKTGIASAASRAGHSGRPAVDGLLPVESCWFLGWISGLPAGSLPGRSVEILLSMETPLQPKLSDASSTLFLVKLKLKFICDRQSVGQSVLVSGGHLGLVTNFSFSSKFPSDSCVFVIL
jgi:hypothetical protein